MKKTIFTLLMLLLALPAFAQFTGGNADGYDKGTYELSSIPTVTTQAVSSITPTTATGNGNITATGGENCDERGILYWDYDNADKVRGDVNGTTIFEENDNAGNFGTGAFTRNLTGLTAETHYNARAYAHNSAGNGYGASIEFWTLSNEPTAQASNPQVDITTTEQLDLSWDDATGETGYVLLRANGAVAPTLTNSDGAAPASASTIVSSTIAADETSYDDAGLTAGQQYTYTLIPYAWDGTNAETYNYLVAGAITFTGTVADIPDVTTNSIDSRSSDQVTVTGEITSVNSNNANHRGIAVGLQSGGDPDESSGLKDEETGDYTPETYQLTVTGLSPQTHYKARAYADNDAGYGYGTSIEFWTLSTEPTVQASNLQANGSSPTQIDLTWDAATFPVSGATTKRYVLLRAQSPNNPIFDSQDGEAPAAGANTTIVSSTLAEGATAYNDNTGLAANLSYNYLLIPFCWNGTDNVTYNYLTTNAPEVTGSTLKSEPTNHVTSFRTGDISHNSIQLLWNDSYAPGASVAPDGYLIRGSDVSYAAISAPIDGTPVADGGLNKNLSPGTENHTFTGLTASTQYYFKIFPYTNSGANINYKTDGSVPQTTGTPTLRPAVWVSENYCPTCGNDGHTWGYDAFDNMTDALAAIDVGGTVHTDDVNTGEDLDLSTNNFTIGNGDLVITGDITGDGYIATESNGSLVQTTDGAEKVFPVGYNGEKYEVLISWTGGTGDEEVKVRVNSDVGESVKSFTGHLWYIEGPSGKNATVTLKFPKTMFPDGFPTDKFLLNQGSSGWIEHEYLGGYTIDDTTEPDYYIITITGVNEF